MEKDLPRSLDLTQFCNKGTKHTYVLEQPHLFDLPDEALIIIFESVKRPLDQIAFLLTCKKTASLFSNVPLNRISKAVRRWRGRVLVDYQHRHLVADMARWRGTFISSNLKLCHSCWRWLPENRVWKDPKTNRDITTLKHVDWLWMIARWKSAGGKICPSCQIPQKFVEGEEFLQPWPEGFGRRSIIRQRLPK